MNRLTASRLASTLSLLTVAVAIGLAVAGNRHEVLWALVVVSWPVFILSTCVAMHWEDEGS